MSAVVAAFSPAIVLCAEPVDEGVCWTLVGERLMASLSDFVAGLVALIARPAFIVARGTRRRGVERRLEPAWRGTVRDILLRMVVREAGMLPQRMTAAWQGAPAARQAIGVAGED